MELQDNNRLYRPVRTTRGKDVVEQECEMLRVKRRCVDGKPSSMEELRAAVYRNISEKVCELRMAQQGMHRARSELVELVRRQVSHGGTEGRSLVATSSVCLIGPRRSGKGKLVSCALKEVTRSGGVQVVRVELNGSAHAKPGAGYRRIAQQLAVFCTVDDEDEDDVVLASALATIRQALIHRKENQVFVFILEDLECFISGGDQQMLYSLLNLCQDPKIQGVLIGTSTLHDVKDAMEKRVRSRFSNREISLPGLEEACQSNEEEQLSRYYRDCAYTMLSLANLDKYNREVARFLDSPVTSSALRRVRRLFEHGDLHSLSELLSDAVAHWEKSHEPSLVKFQDESTRKWFLIHSGIDTSPDSFLMRLSGVDVLLLAALRRMIKHQPKRRDTGFSLVEILEHYSSSLSPHESEGLQRDLPLSVALHALDKLLDCGFLALVAPLSPSSPPFAQIPVVPNLPSERISTIVANHPGFSTLQQRWGSLWVE